MVPIISNDISFHEFSSDSYFIHQKLHDHRIKISCDFYNLLQKLDGKKNLGQLVDELDQKEIDVEVLHDILYNNLGVYGIIANANIKIKKKEKPSYLKLSFIVIPARAIAKVTPYLKVLFRPNVIKALLFLAVLTIGFGIYHNFSNITSENLESVWLYLLLFGFISVTFHEFGHATAAHYFGAAHGGIGGGFYLFSPVYFADVTDIWKLKPRKRIIVNLAGIYFELLICSIYVIIGIAFNIDFLSIVGLFIVLGTLFNLNPFLRSDGYWILTDALGIPNLYKKSSESLKDLLKCAFSRQQTAISKKELFLALYGAVNYIFLAIFLYYVLFLNTTSILYLPINVYEFILEVYRQKQQVTLENLSPFILPLLFYYLLFKFLWTWIFKLKKKSNEKV